MGKCVKQFNVYCAVSVLFAPYMQCRGKDISWKHVIALYYRNAGAATGLCMVPKVKYEHIYLTPRSKMRVDLAAQVRECKLL